ncbi:hypothetical protein GCM10027615_30480 [Plantactinospora veratri]
MKVWIPHPEGLELLGEIPDGVTVEIAPAPDRLPSDPAGVRFWVPPFLAQAAAVPIAAKLPDLRVVQLLSAGADTWAGRLPEHVTLCDARGVHDSSTAEWVVTAILSYLRSFPFFARAQARHEWSYDQVNPTDELAGKRVLIVGAGSIGAATRARLAPFEVSLTMVARTARPAEGCTASTTCRPCCPRRTWWCCWCRSPRPPVGWSTPGSSPRCRTVPCWSTPPVDRWSTPTPWSPS